MASCARVASASASSSPRASPPSSSRRRAPTRARHHRTRRRSTTIARDDDNANDDDVATTTSSSSSIADAEALLISRLSSLPGRGANASAADEEAIAAALAVLEADGGIARPATRDEICGTWRLLYTSKSAFDPRNPLGKRADGSAPGIEGLFRAVFGDDAGEKMAAGMTSAASSSPIQRTVTSLEAFTIQQAIRLRGRDDNRVDQIVQFGDSGYLRLSAAASVDEASAPSRIDFAFDLAYFEIRSLPPFGFKPPGGPIRIPYPVPFKLLGDEAKGWLETTYLGADVRVSKGNKGTTFVLVREASDGTGTPLPYEF